MRGGKSREPCRWVKYKYQALPFFFCDPTAFHSEGLTWASNAPGGDGMPLVTPNGSEAFTKIRQDQCHGEGGPL